MEKTNFNEISDVFETGTELNIGLLPTMLLCFVCRKYSTCN